MRAIALDVGERRIGVAVGDTELRIAVPAGAVDRAETPDVFQRVLAMAAERDANVIVVGLPLSMNGRRGPQAESTLAFVELLRQVTDLDIQLVDERLTSVDAERRLRQSAPRGRGKSAHLPKGAIDAGAAVLILQSWLDSH